MHSKGAFACSAVSGGVVVAALAMLALASAAAAADFFLFDWIGPVLIWIEIEMIFLVLLKLHFTHFDGHSELGLFIHFSHTELTINRRKVILSSKVFFTSWRWLANDVDVTYVLFSIHFRDVLEPCVEFHIGIF